MNYTGTDAMQAVVQRANEIKTALSILHYVDGTLFDSQESWSKRYWATTAAGDNACVAEHDWTDDAYSMCTGGAVLVAGRRLGYIDAIIGAPAHNMFCPWVINALASALPEGWYEHDLGPRFSIVAFNDDEDTTFSMIKALIARAITSLTNELDSLTQTHEPQGELELV